MAGAGRNNPNPIRRKHKCVDVNLYELVVAASTINRGCCNFRFIFHEVYVLNTHCAVFPIHSAPTEKRRNDI